MIRNHFIRAALLLLLASGLHACMQSVGPGGVQQSAGPFQQSVGPGGVSQNAGPFGSQTVGPGGVQQSMGPFKQSVGPGGVQQSAGPFGSQSVGANGVKQTAGPASTSSAGGNTCRISCSGRSYSASCPARENPLCQCSHAPYASCVGSVQPRQ